MLPPGPWWCLCPSCCQGSCLGAAAAESLVVPIIHVSTESLEPCCAEPAHRSLALGWLVLPLTGYCNRKAGPTPQGRSRPALEKDGPIRHHRCATHLGSTLDPVIGNAGEPTLRDEDSSYPALIRQVVAWVRERYPPPLHYPLWQAR